MAKVFSLVGLFSLIFSGTLMFAMNLETLSQIGGLIGVSAALFFAYLAHRKKLLNTGFITFQNQYRIEMDEFKKTAISYINRNDDRHTTALTKIVDLNLATQKQVAEQIGACKLIQGRKDVITKSERNWKAKMEEKTGKIFEDVEEMKETISYMRGKMNGKT